MRILFTTDYPDKVSTQLNEPSLALLSKINGVEIDFYNSEFDKYDVVLFMGYDPKVSEARQANPKIKIGVIDPRPSTLHLSFGADFIVANSIEMQDWCANYFTNIFIYPIYPILEEKTKEHIKKDSIVIGYHGNKVHLNTIYPSISAALDMLANSYNVELWAVYDKDGLGISNIPLLNMKNVKLKHIQWSEEAYELYMSEVDIGIVPNIIPIHDIQHANQSIMSYPKVFNEHDKDFLHRFKATTNAGRLFVFAQYGVPVIADMVPSALQVIRDGENGYIASSVGGWYRALKKLADSPGLRKSFSSRMKADFENMWSIDVLNKKLFTFLGHLDRQSSVPVGLLDAARIDSKSIRKAMYKSRYEMLTSEFSLLRKRFNNCFRR